MEVGDLLDPETIKTLLEHAEEFWEWVEVLIEKGEMSLDLLVFLLDIVGGLAMNSISLYICATTGRGRFYEDGTLDFRAGWPLSMVRSLLNETAHMVVDVITNGIEEPESISSNFVHLEDPEGKLYLHVYVEGEEVKVYYAENKALAILPSNAIWFSCIVNATEAQEETEEYTIAYFGVREGEVVEERLISDEIKKGEEQEYKMCVDANGKMESILREFDVIWDKKTYPVEVLSNSTISNFNFSQPDKRVSFDVTGPTDTIGYCQVTIPIELLNGNFTVWIDGNRISYMLEKNDTHSFIYFRYNHTTHKVTIEGTTVIPEFPITIFLSLLMIATLIMVIIAKSRIRRKQEQH